MTATPVIKALRWEMNRGASPFVVHATLLQDDKDVILVDTGIPGQLELIKQALEQEGVWEQLTKIIITHQDLDHIGSLPELVQATDGRVEVIAHELAKPYILGETPIMKRGVLATPSKVDTTVQDGDLLPYCGGIQVVFTPGHTPDHICLYHRPSRTLISGDALTSHEGVLMPPDANFTPDMPAALKSVAKLQGLDIDTIITYHGGVVTEQIPERLAAIAAGSGA